MKGNLLSAAIAANAGGRHAHRMNPARANDFYAGKTITILVASDAERL